VLVYWHKENSMNTHTKDEVSGPLDMKDCLLLGRRQKHVSTSVGVMGQK